MLATRQLPGTPALVLSLSLVAVGLAGCPDPDASFDAFAERANSIPLPPPGRCGITVQSLDDGEFFLALSSQLAQTKPIVYLAEVTSDARDFSMHLQALRYDDRKTPVGPAFDVGPFPIDAQGQFVAALPELHVPADANFLHAEVVAQVTLKGSVCEDFVCGTVEGHATEPAPVDLHPEKSAFTMERVDKDGVFPEPPQINCAGDLATPVGKL